MIRLIKASAYFLILFAIPLLLYFLVKDDPGMVIVSGHNVITQKNSP